MKEHNSKLSPAIREAVNAVESATGLHLCFKLFDKEREQFSVVGLVYPHYSIHRTPFCLGVKVSHNLKCIECDLRAVPLRCIAKRAPFVNLCHANANEIVFPLFLENRLAAMLFLGQFRVRRSQPESLPFFTAKQVRHAMGLGRVLAAYLAELLLTPRYRGGPKRSGRGERIRAFLEARLAENPDLPALASHLGLSASRAAHVVVEATGQTFTALRDSIRLERAKNLLQTTYYKIPQIAAECGFTSAHYFHRFFRKQTGITPASFRDRQQMEG